MDFKSLILAGFLAVALLLPSPAHAGCAHTVIDTLQEVSRPLRDPLLSEQQMAEVHALFSDPHLSSREAARKAFEIILPVRLGLLPPRIRTRVRRILDEKLEHVEGKEINGGFSAKKKRIVIKIPGELRDTPIEFATLMHELEHAIHNATAGFWPQFRYVLSRRKDGMAGIEEVKFFDEEGAMLAEWNYIQSLPLEVRRATLNEIQESEILSDHEKTFAARLLNPEDLSSEAYLEANHQDLRYSGLAIVWSKLESRGAALKREEIRSRKSYKVTRVAMQAAMVVGLGWWGWHHCTSLATSGSTEGLYYSNVCGHLGFQRVDR